MTKNLPSKRYPSYMELYEKYISGIQAEVKKLEQTQALYTSFIYMAQDANFDAYPDIELNSHSLIVTWELTSSNYLEPYLKKLKPIVENFRTKYTLHGGRTLVEYAYDSVVAIRAYAYIKEDLFDILFQFKLPREGCRDIKLVYYEAHQTYIQTHIKYIHTLEF